MTVKQPVKIGVKQYFFTFNTILNKIRYIMLNFDENEFTRWINQANQTLNSSKNDLKAGDYNWSCFKTQQTAELAIKALLRGLGKLAVGVSLIKLTSDLENTGLNVPQEIKKCCQKLEIHYIPARYPDAYAEGAPYEYYDKSTADEAIKCANKIFKFIKK